MSGPGEGTPLARRRGPDWDARYAAAQGGLFGEAPNAWLVMCLARPELAPRHALSLAEGDGRNGTWLARQGLETTGVDLSAEATRRALARDAAAGVTAERIAADLFDWDPGARRWDLVALICLQGPPPLRRRGLSVAARALAPGGWLVLEGFGAPPPGAPVEGPGPSAPELRWSVAESLGWLANEGLELHEAIEGRVRLDEGRLHQGVAWMTRLLLRRPPA
ncbi:class I SAM-dependent methyltransferase [Albimonas sp. CAU 1670]|uniref:class I SAM-dependent methyltransferase n=1 Tax=Albimonas sp. CAU 1670 TaxID=3032599 RepID=UPI0023DCA519|nr:class I SAM-dependent methyltransferase [Albimonas sp. CAU 1670]MDF2233542.1 class I SAM-dependent methyltransferase [Albimonas sp. CAU 1670]